MQHVNRGVREAVALLYVLTVGVVWVYGRVHSPAVGANHPVVFTTADAVFWLFTLASGFVVFGRRVINAALDTLERLRGGGDDES